MSSILRLLGDDAPEGRDGVEQTFRGEDASSQFGEFGEDAQGREGERLLKEWEETFGRAGADFLGRSARPEERREVAENCGDRIGGVGIHAPSDRPWRRAGRGWGREN